MSVTLVSLFALTPVDGARISRLERQRTLLAHYANGGALIALLWCEAL